MRNAFDSATSRAVTAAKLFVLSIVIFASIGVQAQSWMEEQTKCLATCGGHLDACRAKADAQCDGSFNQCIESCRAAAQATIEAQSKKSTAQCGLVLGAKRHQLCVGSDEQCECLSAKNTCPYSITMTYMQDTTKGKMRFSTTIEAGKTSNSDACTTGNSTQSIEYLGSHRT